MCVFPCHFFIGSKPNHNVDTLRRAASGGSQRSIDSRTISFRVSDQTLADFDAALARRGISDRPAALRSLIRSADKVLIAPDPELCRALAAWSAALKLHGDAINRVAKQLNEAKLRGEPLPPIAASTARLCKMCRQLRR